MAQRNAWLTSEFRRPVKFLDELTTAEASRAIDLLKEMKDEKWEEDARLKEYAAGYDPNEDYLK
jgi:hypothetical protein